MKIYPGIVTISLIKWTHKYRTDAASCYVPKCIKLQVVQPKNCKAAKSKQSKNITTRISRTSDKTYSCASKTYFLTDGLPVTTSAIMLQRYIQRWSKLWTTCFVCFDMTNRRLQPSTVENSIETVTLIDKLTLSGKVHIISALEKTISHYLTRITRTGIVVPGSTPDARTF